jgi:hypothetical protein
MQTSEKRHIVARGSGDESLRDSTMIQESPSYEILYSERSISASSRIAANLPSIQLAGFGGGQSHPPFDANSW